MDGDVSEGDVGQVETFEAVCRALDREAGISGADNQARDYFEGEGWVRVAIKATVEEQPGWVEDGPLYVLRVTYRRSGR